MNIHALFKTIPLAMMFSASAPAVEFRINQVGYATTTDKVAVVVGSKATTFSLQDQTGKVALQGKLSHPQTWAYSGESAQLADFSQLTQSGEFQLVLNTGESVAVTLSQNPYIAPLKAASRAYYYNRAGTDIPAKHGGQWARPAGHPDTKVKLHESAVGPKRDLSTTLSSPKGWYDAGDYNKYVVNSAISMYTLLSALQEFPAGLSKLDLNIPESQDPLPDLLNEVLWNLDWFETMQDPDDGGVYHKLTTLKFSGHIMPHEAKAPRFMVQKSLGAALDFAAVCAYASRVLESYPGFTERAKTLRAKAEQAWEWAKANPESRYQQPKDVRTGTYIYDSEDFQDEWFWAAVELSLTTKDAKFLRSVDLEKVPTGIPSWDFVAPLGWISLARSEDMAFEVASARAKQQLQKVADRLLAHWQNSPYHTSMGTFDKPMGASGADFVWGSNSVLANHNFVLYHAYHNALDTALPAIVANLDYLLGKNATGYSFVTGFGTQTPMNIHHRVSWSDGIEQPVPGFLVGGPHAGQQDKCETYTSTLPAKSYTDDTCSYATNEVTINWNAPLVFSLALLNQRQQSD